MTDRDDHQPTGDDRSSLGDALDSLKHSGGTADELSVSGGPTRMSWRSVTEDDAQPAPTPEPATERSSFQFDLGSALQRLGEASAPPEPPSARREPPAQSESSPAVGAEASAEPLPTREPAGRQEPSAEPLPTREPAGRHEPSAEPLPMREPAHDAPAEPLPTRRPGLHDGPPAEPLPTRRPGLHDGPPAEPLPTRRAPDPVTPAAADTPRRSAPGSAASVFDDLTPAPRLPTVPTASPTVEPVAPIIPPATASGLPTLPSAVPTAPPVIEPVASATATSDINAVRSAQMRAKRDDRRGRVVGRTFLVLVVLAGAVGGALVFGRSLLFPTQWDAGLTAAVDAVQESRGAEFPETVPLRVVPDGEYAQLALDAWFGGEWQSRFPQWRALGIANGAADSEAVAAAVVAWRPAFFDPVTDEIYRAESASDDAVAPALALALEEVFERQTGASPSPIEAPSVGVLSVASEQQRNARAIDRELLVGSAATFAVDGTGAPLPLLVEMAVIDTLGDELVAAAGEPLVFGEPYPDIALDATVVDAPMILASLVPPGAQPTGDPVSWGVDSWALVLGNRLPPESVDRLVSLIEADSYRSIERSATPCFVAQFQVADDAAAAELLGGLSRWAMAAPLEAVATATLLMPNTIEVIACDPGAAVETSLDRAAVDRALARLGVIPAG